MNRKRTNFGVFSGILRSSVFFHVSIAMLVYQKVHFAFFVRRQWPLRHLTFRRRTSTFAMAGPHEVKVKTLEGGALTVEVMPTNTIEELKDTGWWFQIFFIFTPIWGKFPF